MYYVYKLNCKDGVYVGMTKNLKRRLREHMRFKGKSNYPHLSYEIMVVTQTRELALYFEDIAIQKYGTINQRRSGLITEDHNAYNNANEKKNMAKTLIRKRKYTESHRESERERLKIYRENHKEICRERVKESKRKRTEGDKEMFPHVPNALLFARFVRRMFKC